MLGRPLRKDYLALNGICGLVFELTFAIETLTRDTGKGATITSIDSLFLIQFMISLILLALSVRLTLIVLLK